MKGFLLIVIGSLSAGSCFAISLDAFDNKTCAVNHGYYCAWHIEQAGNNVLVLDAADNPWARDGYFDGRCGTRETRLFKCTNNMCFEVNSSGAYIDDYKKVIAQPQRPGFNHESLELLEDGNILYLNGAEQVHKDYCHDPL